MISLFVFSSQVRGQTQESLAEHDPVYCGGRPEQWGEIDECPPPVFTGTDPVVGCIFCNKLCVGVIP